MAHISLDYGLLHGAALGVEGQLHLVVLQYNLLFLTRQCSVEEGGGVGLHLGLGFRLSLAGGHLAGFLHLGVLGLGDGVLHECSPLLLGGWLVVPAETYQHYGY